MQTTGSLVIPLRAWSMFEFIDNQNAGDAVNWMFYGLTLGMGFYNLFLFAFVRQKEHLLYSLYVFAMAALTLTLQGHTSQYVFPNHPVIANQMMPFTTAVLFACALLFIHASLDVRTLLPRCSMGLRYAVLPSAVALAIGSLFLPNSICIRATIVLGFAITLGGMPVIFFAMRAGSRPARIFLIAWGCLILSAVLEEALETVAALAVRGEVQVKRLPFDESACLRADPLRVKQVLINVIGNAIKFSPPRCTVEVSVTREASHYLFQIRDQGIGIVAGDLDRIFRTFEQVDQGDTRKYGGTGLGLSISRSFVELHGGEIWVQSELGKGSTFYIRLPAQGQLSEDRPAVAAVA